MIMMILWSWWKFECNHRHLQQNLHASQKIGSKKEATWSILRIYMVFFFANPHVKNYRRCEKMLVIFFMTENSVILILHANKTYYLHFTLPRFFLWYFRTFFHAQQLALTKNTTWYPTLSPRCSPPTLNFESSLDLAYIKLMLIISAFRIVWGLLGFEALF